VSCQIRNDVDPSEIVSLGEEVEALVLTKEDKDGRLVLSKKRAQYERAWGDDRGHSRSATASSTGPVIEVVKGGLIVDIGLRGFLPASLVELRRVRDLQPYVGQEHHGEDHRARQEPQQRRPLPPGLAGGDAEGVSARSSSTTSRSARSARAWCRRVVSFGAFVDLGGMDGLIHVSRAVVEARRPPRLGRRRRRRGVGAGARRRPRAGSASACR
jgi:small subunit ribosomal protein S1